MLERGQLRVVDRGVYAVLVQFVASPCAFSVLDEQIVVLI